MADDQPKMSSLVLPAIKLCGMSFGLFYFTCLILLDIWNAIKSKPRTWWIPGKALILSALSIQVLSYLDYSNISFSDTPNHTDIAKLLGNQLVIDSGRLVICVFIGYLLPGMATRGSARASSDIVALVVSLFTAIISELFYVHKAGNVILKVDYNYVYDFFDQWQHNPKIKIWFIVSSSVFLVAIVLLILLLVSAILAGKTVRCMLKQRINSAISLNKPHQAKECWEKFEDEVLKSWLLCRAAQPQYVIARSVLSSSTGLVVSICIVLFIAKTLKLRSNIIHYDDGLDWLRHTTFGLQCLFVALGGLVIFRRWFRAVIYFPIFFRKGIKCPPSWPRCSVEDFWTRSISELINMYDLQQWRRDQKPAADKTCFGGIFMKVFTKFKLHKLLYFVWALQKFLVWFSKCCWLFSEMFFGSTLMRRAVIGKDTHLFKDHPSEDELGNYKKVLEHLCMPGEKPASLWLTNKASIGQARDRIENGKKSECQGLIDLIKERPDTPYDERFVYRLESLPLVKVYFPALNESWWKMTAVSLLRIIIKLEADGRKKGEAIKAYKQAWDLMTFVESSNSEQPNSINVTQVFDFEADLVSMVADKEFEELEKMHDSSQVSTTNDPKRALDDFLEKAEEQLRIQKLLEGEQTRPDVEKAARRIGDGPQDSKDWNKIVPSYSMYRVCKILNSRNDNNLKELVDYLHNCLGDVIVDCLERLPKMLVRSFGEWALEFQEDDMWEAFHIAGKCKKVVEGSELKLIWEMSESTEGQAQ
ncbi:hypothetical protein SUGI_0042810 [Cryptomeria japonica]|uniref:uncharacterized protein LOC131857380 n=1 Tax=Cryptomeria japonica TaxID=3369 RepID=UPI002408C0F2|nr:uncharacterized protein LOC131857380 [Cryptomeria japonica]GLJ06601.1 hypothetical protein SUGI_0042810 [Cryptomeria japonica]